MLGRSLIQGLQLKLSKRFLPYYNPLFTFPDLLNNEAKLDPPRGVCLRWAINADGEGGTQLLLQSLPAPASIINSRPAFKRDSCPGKTVIAFNMSVNIDYNPITFGPTPILFSSNPEVTNQVLSTSTSARLNMIKGTYLIMQSQLLYIGKRRRKNNISRKLQVLYYSS